MRCHEQSREPNTRKLIRGCARYEHSFATHLSNSSLAMGIFAVRMRAWICGFLVGVPTRSAAELAAACVRLAMLLTQGKGPHPSCRFHVRATAGVPWV